MQYNIFINQHAVYMLGLQEKLDLTDLALFDFIYHTMNNPAMPKTTIDGEDYWTIRASLVIQECPLLGINHRNVFMRHMNKLCDVGLIKRYGNNQKENTSLYKKGAIFTAFVMVDNHTTHNVQPATEKLHDLQPKCNTPLQPKSCTNIILSNNIIPNEHTKEDNSNEVSFSKEKSTSTLELSKKKPLSNANCAKERDEEFDRFWVLYDKKIGRDKCERLWARLKKEDKEKIFETLPLYIQSTPDKQFRKNPTTYLNPSEKHWLDEIIQQTPQQRVTNYQKQNDYGNSERNHFRDEEDNRERDYNFTF